MERAVAVKSLFALVSSAHRLVEFLGGRFDSFVDSIAGRLCEASGDALIRLRHTPNTGETP